MGKKRTKKLIKYISKDILSKLKVFLLIDDQLRKSRYLGVYSYENFVFF